MTEYRKDEYKKVQIPFGFNEKLERVLLSLFHTFFVAMTGHGKTLGMKSLLLRFHELFPEWKILIIDSKDKRDYADLNADIPICFVEATDPLDLKNLMEPIVGAKMMYYFDKIIEEATFDTLGEIQRNIHKKVVDADEGRIKIHGKELGKLRVLDFTLAKLVALIEKPNIISELKLHDGFNVMPVSLPDVKNPNLKRAFQQLITRSALLLLLVNPLYERTLLVLDENHKWNPQRYSSICKQPLSEFISEGRSQDKIVWLSDQALTKIDKEALKNVKVWIVGQQMESNEVEDAKNTVNDMTDLNVIDSDIKTLKIGNFILVDGLHGNVEKVYLQPYNVPDKVALQIAQGADPELAEPYIMEFEKRLHTSKSQGDDEMYKQKYEDEMKLVTKLKEDLDQEKRKNKDLEKSKKTMQEELQVQGDAVKTLETLRTIFTGAPPDAVKMQDFESLTTAVQIIRKDLNNVMQAVENLNTSANAGGVGMPYVPGITVAEVDERIEQRLSSSPSPVTMVTVDVDQRIKDLVKNEVINRIVTRIQALPEPAKKAAWWLHERKQATVKDLYNFIYGGQTEYVGRAVGTFSANVVNPLVDAWLIVKENGNIRWNLSEKLQAELPEVLTNSDLENVPKYLASLLL